MNRIFQALALCLSLGLLTFLACRAQSTKPAAPRSPPNEAVVPNAAAVVPDAAATLPPEPYLPASKSGGPFLDHQQAPR